MDQNRVEGFARTVGGKLQGAAGDLTGDPKLQADGLIDKVAGKAQGAYGSAKDAVRDVTGEYGSGVLDTIEDYGDMLADKVDERPLTALLIAAGVGFLLGLVTSSSPKVVYRRR